MSTPTSMSAPAQQHSLNAPRSIEHATGRAQNSTDTSAFSMNRAQHTVTRRHALTASLATLTLAALTACSSDTTKPLPERDSYAGPVDLSVISYENTGDYEPATVEHSTRNAPRPQAPAALTNQSMEGSYRALAYFIATVNYGMLSGSVEPLQEITLKDWAPGSDAFEKDIETLGENNWVTGFNYSVSITADKPEKLADDQYRWPLTQTTHMEGRMRAGTYTARPATDTTPSPSVSASAAASPSVSAPASASPVSSIVPESQGALMVFSNGSWKLKSIS